MTQKKITIPDTAWFHQNGNMMISKPVTEWGLSMAMEVKNDPFTCPMKLWHLASTYSRTPLLEFKDPTDRSFYMYETEFNRILMNPKRLNLVNAETPPLTWQIRMCGQQYSLMLVDQ